MASALTRQYLKSEYKRAQQLYESLQKKYLALRKNLNSFADGYIESEEYFPWRRSKMLHELVQTITADSIMQDIRSCIEESTICSGIIGQPKATIPGLLAKVDEINALKNKKPLKSQGQGHEKGQGECAGATEGQGPAGEKRPLIQSKSKKLFQKIKRVTGFLIEPVENEDVMTNERLEFCRQTRDKQIKALHEEFKKVHAALNKLSRDYSAARAQCSCCQYCTIKTLIETALDETDAYTHYES